MPVFVADLALSLEDRRKGRKGVTKRTHPTGGQLEALIRGNTFGDYIAKVRAYNKRNNVRGPLLLVLDRFPSHRTKAVRAAISARGLKLIDWAANSPDLNVEENFWRSFDAEFEKTTRRAGGLGGFDGSAEPSLRLLLPATHCRASVPSCGWQLLLRIRRNRLVVASAPPFVPRSAVDLDSLKADMRRAYMAVRRRSLRPPGSERPGAPRLDVVRLCGGWNARLGRVVASGGERLKG